MPIYHLHVNTGGRRSKNAIGESTPKSADAKIRYICKSGRYARKRDCVVHVESGHMPEWARQASQSSEVTAALRYWQAADRHERENGRLFKEIEVALPDEMTSEQRLELIRAFAEEVATAPPEGSLPYTLAIHARVESGGDLSHFHAHLVLSERVNDGVERAPERWFKRAVARTGGAPPRPGDGGARKTMHLRRKTWLQSIRERWAQLTNDALARAGHASRVDHRSLEAQGITREPEIKIGVWASAAERRGISVLRSDIARAQRAFRVAEAKATEAQEVARRLEEQEREEAKKEEEEYAWRYFADLGRDLDATIAVFRREAILFAVRPAAHSELASGRGWKAQNGIPSDLLGSSWRVSRAADQSVVFESDEGRLADMRREITAQTGNDTEISAMLVLARGKGWTSLQFCGNDHFKRRSMAAALDAGFSVAAATEDDQRLLAELRKAREGAHRRPGGGSTRRA